MISAERALVWFLRGTAVALVAAAPAVVMPFAWMQAIHEWLGLGSLPDVPIVVYMARSISVLCVGLGMVSWFISRDVRRYQPLLRFAVPLSLAFAVTMTVIDEWAGLPRWWTVVDNLFLVAWTAALYGLVRRQNSANPVP